MKIKFEVPKAKMSFNADFYLKTVCLAHTKKKKKKAQTIICAKQTE